MALINVELLKLGLRIRASRKMLGRSQKGLSNQCGLDKSFFSGVERGERNLTFASLCQICTGLNCDIAAVTSGIPHSPDAHNMKWEISNIAAIYVVSFRSGSQGKSVRQSPWFQPWRV